MTKGIKDMKYQNHKKLINLILKKHQKTLHEAGRGRPKKTATPSASTSSPQANAAEINKAIEIKNKMETINDALSIFKIHLDSLNGSGWDLLINNIASALEKGRKVITAGERIEDGDTDKSTIDYFNKLLSDYGAQRYDTNLAKIKNFKVIISNLLATQEAAEKAVANIKTL